LRCVEDSRLLQFNAVGEIVQKRLLCETSKPIGENEAPARGRRGESLREGAVIFVGVGGASCHLDKAYDVGIGPRFRYHRSAKRMTGEDRRSVLEREDTASVSHVIGQ